MAGSGSLLTRTTSESEETAFSGFRKRIVWSSVCGSYDFVCLLVWLLDCVLSVFSFYNTSGMTL